MKLGLFGGTFDPVHNAHLFVAEAARVELALERVLFLPTRGSHYRMAPTCGLEDRLAMLRLAIAGNVNFTLDESDVDDVASGYTADLLPRLRRRYADAKFTFIAGGDSLVEWPWQRFDQVLAQLDMFAIAPRAEREPERLNAFLATLEPVQRAQIVLLDLPALRGSATLVRAQSARGGSIRYLVPEGVHRYIRDNALYPAPAESHA
ncbi:MAG: nicotinate (nicotinamide) nucleotide adenylyltransferase [Candidatus Eremiobacteraeota bacterium]|nr:nicotinate (nicotinamide) nucleotide adenylyltransferase [Candidatus Eremiobacteraeota bacterium]